ncbi:MAG: HAD-IC family P-type ATPase [Patescibacteria group bacterium]|nr:HAD-IC family P-type ATPase [Patescibacteria group bacterium]
MAQQDILKYSAKSIAEVSADFGVNFDTGLSEVEAEKRLGLNGRNELSNQKVKWWDILWRQLASPFIYFLFGAGVLSLSLREFIDGLMIFLFLLINTALGFYQEFRSEKTLELLKTFVASYSKVFRGGKEMVIASSLLVPGDLIILETGDKIPADVRFIDCINTTVDESILTGESIAIKKVASELSKPATEMFEAVNFGFSGTALVNGKAKAIVLATGKGTALGQVSKLVAETKHVSNFEKGIAKFSKFILQLIVVTLIFIFLANIFIKGSSANIIELIIFSIALAVSVIPEALPVVTTFSLSRGALRLAKQKVVVKRLSAVEDLGGIEVLCTDKTGTLTENKLTVIDLYGQADTVFWSNLATSSPQEKKLEPFDIALWDRLSGKEKNDLKKYQRLADVPFDPLRRRNSVLAKDANQQVLIVRGAPEAIISLCSNFTSAQKSKALKWVSEQGEVGHRVLAVAKRELHLRDYSTVVDNEKDLKFIGIISFTDPIKSTTTAAVKHSRELGVSIKIITGDSREVAGAVAKQIGLIDDCHQVISGEELDQLSVSKQLAAVESFSVFARISPEQKYKIIELLQKKFAVGFLGEGINDAPALKIAGVSMVVQSAADIAREAADIVLINKSLKSIVDGIKEGRKIFANTTKYIRATLSSNFGNFYAVAVASLLINYLPMLALQILLVNLLSDFPMIAIASDNIDSEEIENPKQYNLKEIVLIATLLGVVSSVFDFIFFGIYSRISPHVLQTNWFIGSILTELVFMFSIRTKRPFFRSKRPSSPLLWLSVLAAFVTVGLPYTYLGQHIFSLTPPTPQFLAIDLALVLAYFVVTETVKLMYYRRFSPSVASK